MYNVRFNTTVTKTITLCGVIITQNYSTHINFLDKLIKNSLYPNATERISYIQEGVLLSNIIILEYFHFYYVKTS